MDKHEYYNHKGVSVNSAELSIKEERIPLEYIASFRVVEASAIPRLGLVLICIGALILVNQGPLFNFGGIILISGILLRFYLDKSYTLKLTTSEGEIAVIKSSDVSHLDSIQKALDSALANKRKQNISSQNPMSLRTVPTIK